MYHSSTAGVVRMRGASQQEMVSLKSCVVVSSKCKKNQPWSNCGSVRNRRKEKPENQVEI